MTGVTCAGAGHALTHVELLRTLSHFQNLTRRAVTEWHAPIKFGAHGCDDACNSGSSEALKQTLHQVRALDRLADKVRVAQPHHGAFRPRTDQRDASSYQ